MAELVKAVSKPERIAGGDAHVVRWEGLSATLPEGAPMELPPFSARTMQVTGEFGEGSLVLYGSLDGVYWSEMIDFVADDMHGIDSDARYVKPKVMNPDKSTKLTAILLLRKLA